MEDITCEMCIFCYRDMESDAEGKFKYHCRYFEKFGLDPVKIEFAKKCKLFTKVGEEIGARRNRV